MFTENHFPWLWLPLYNKIFPTCCYCLVTQSCPTLLRPPWIVVPQDSLFMGFPRQEYWRGLPLPLPGDFPDQASNPHLSLSLSFFFFSFIFISWRLITLQYCSGFCHTLTRISHGFTCIPHPDPPSHFPLHLIPHLLDLLP